MSWLTYADDEVRHFHVEFEGAANAALSALDNAQKYEWIHHLRTPGRDLVPDFVLQQRDSKKWIAAFEIKRRREAVHSTRNQIQAKGYAEENQDLFLLNRPRYFAITNLEDTLLFALNGNRPPRECRLSEGLFASGRFETTANDEHRENFVNSLIRILNIFLSESAPSFDVIWPGVLSDFLVYSSNLPYIDQINITEPTSPHWHLVRDYFADSVEIQSSQIFILRCLMAEYLRGILHRNGHPRSNILVPLQSTRATISTANAIDAIRSLDFQAMFGNSESEIYRNLTDQGLINHLRDYISEITSQDRRIVNLARERIDSPELLDSVITSIYPVESQDERGKVTTDPELAAILANLVIRNANDRIIDPCCGDGALLSAAFDRLIGLGLNYGTALGAIKGVEADPISTRLACVRLALKQPAAVAPNPPISLTYGDLFANANEIRSANVVLMNPPFKRYEAQDQRPIPLELREYYASAINSIDDVPSQTTSGQANLYNFYIEYVTKASAANTRIGIILDNRWYHNKYSQELRQFLLQNFEIEAIVEYPHSAFFEDWTIATSILILRKPPQVDATHSVMFIRSKVDPRSVDLNELLRAYIGQGEWPLDWTCRIVPQAELSAEHGWKQYFAQELANDYRLTELPTLEMLFTSSRRGSLEKEGGGIGILEFPFNRRQFGPRRRLKAPPRRRFQSEVDRDLTRDENDNLASLAQQIPANFRGLALRNSDYIQGFELSLLDVTQHETLEPPSLRARYDLYQENRSPWLEEHVLAVEEMRQDPQVGSFLEAVANIVNLNESVLPADELWNVLREPVAGELILPRKTRQGHRVHINPFAFDPAGRQVRISSNFITYRGCIANSPDIDLDSETAVRLIAAFLVSSFGQLQFEIEGYNREGLLALEKEQFNRIRVFDPRWISANKRQEILEVFSSLPYPIPTDRLSYNQPERNILDRLFAVEICTRYNQFELELLLNEVHLALDEWLVARQP